MQTPKITPVEMVDLPGGTVTLGDPNYSPYGSINIPQEKVSIKKFAMAKYETTQKEYVDIMGVNPMDPGRGGIGDKNPIEVSWYDAVKYSLYRTLASEEISPAVRAELQAMKDAWIDNDFNKAKEYLEYALESEECYRLPSEAEWEYAARGGINTIYLWGNTHNQAEANKYGWNNNNTTGYETHPVGELQANGFGLYDVMGNVWEWCIDETKFEIENYSIRLGVSGGWRVMRGGDVMNSSSRGFDLAWRSGIEIDENRGIPSGFRLARTVR